MRLWFLVFTLIPALAAIYVGVRMWQLVPAPATAIKVVLEVLLGGGFIALLTMFLGVRVTPGESLLDRMPLNVASAVYSYGASWLFVLIYAVLLLAGIDVVRHVFRPTFFLASWSGLAFYAFTLTALFVYGYFHFHDKRRVEVNVTTHKPLTGGKLKVVMVSDLHLGYINRANEARRWVELINREQADLVLFGGDVIDMTIRPLRDENVAAVLRQINVPVYACLGNHEYISGKDVLPFYEEAGIHLLVDSVTQVGDVNIAGRDDNSNVNRQPLQLLLHDIDKSRFTFLLDHQPYHLEQAQQCDVDFQFSGHTHEGQMFPLNLFVHAVYECGYGNFQKGDTRYYISSGIGIWGAKFRIGTCSEYVVLNLRSQ